MREKKEGVGEYSLQHNIWGGRGEVAMEPDREKHIRITYWPVKGGHRWIILKKGRGERVNSNIRIDLNNLARIGNSVKISTPMIRRIQRINLDDFRTYWKVYSHKQTTGIWMGICRGKGKAGPKSTSYKPPEIKLERRTLLVLLHTR